jgi:hypothetical protein
MDEDLMYDSCCAPGASPPPRGERSAIARRAPWLCPLAGIAGALLAAGTLGTAPAHAAEIPADAFRPALDGRGIIDTELGTTTGAGAVDIAVFFDGVQDPLVLTATDDTGASRRAALVAQRTGANVVASFGFAHWGQIGFDLPFVVAQSRPALTVADIGAIAGTALAPAGNGDLRIRPKAWFARARDVGVDVALLPTLTLPTHSDRGSFLGEAGFTFVPEVAVSREFGPLAAATNLGLRLRGVEPRLGNIDIGHEFTGRAALAWRHEATGLDVGASVIGSTALRAPFASIATTPVEVLGGLGWRPVDWLRVSLGGGTGVIAGLGVPAARVFLGVQFSSRDDGDGSRSAERCRGPLRSDCVDVASGAVPRAP